MTRPNCQVDHWPGMKDPIPSNISITLSDCLVALQKVRECEEMLTPTSFQEACAAIHKLEALKLLKAPLVQSYLDEGSKLSYAALQKVTAPIIGFQPCPFPWICALCIFMHLLCISSNLVPSIAATLVKLRLQDGHPTRASPGDCELDEGPL